MSNNPYVPLREFKLPPKPRAGLYIDDSNLYHLGKESGWMCDYKKIYKWVSSLNTIVYAKIFMGMPKYEPARSISMAIKDYFEKNGFDVIDKDLKRLRDLDIVYVASGDSDFLRTKDKVLKSQKHIKFLAYELNCASEIRYSSWFQSLDEIRSEIERVPHKGASINA